MAPSLNNTPQCARIFLLVLVSLSMRAVHIGNLQSAPVLLFPFAWGGYYSQRSDSTLLSKVPLLTFSLVVQRSSSTFCFKVLLQALIQLLFVSCTASKFCFKVLLRRSASKFCFKVPLRSSASKFCFQRSASKFCFKFCFKVLLYSFAPKFSL